MSQLAKRVIIGVLVLTAAVAVWQIHSRKAQAKRDASYQVALEPYKRDLALGLSKAEVEQYLDSRNVAYHVTRIGGHEGESYLIKVGEDPGSLVCEPWNVYVALEFGSSESLKRVYIDKIGTCL